jgi:hypothetical protein
MIPISLHVKAFQLSLLHYLHDYDMIRICEDIILASKTHGGSSKGGGGRSKRKDTGGESSASPEKKQKKPRKVFNHKAIAFVSSNAKVERDMC